MSIGAQLRASREARGLTIEAVAHTTRVQPRILAAIERDDVAVVPPRPFGRGFVRAYAAEMGMDGERTARDYFAQFAPAVPPAAAHHKPAAGPIARPTRGWILAVAIAGMIAGILLALLIAPPARTQGPSPAPEPPPAPAPSATPVLEPTPPAAPPATAVAVAGAPAAPTPDPGAAPIALVLTAIRPVWVEATADGRRALFQTLTPESPATVTAQRVVVMRVGDAGALSWRINGRDAGSMGRQGQVRDVTITPRTVDTIQ